MMYLVEKYLPKENTLLPSTSQPSKRAEVLSWLFWQMGSAPYVGGGFGHFFSYAPEPRIEYAINRFTMETKRQLDVLDKQLAGKKYICGNELTLADMAIWPWYGNIVLDRLYSGSAEFLQVDEYPNLMKWAVMMETENSAVRKGRMVNRSWGADKENPLYKDIPALKERHSREDWEVKE